MPAHEVSLIFLMPLGNSDQNLWWAWRKLGNMQINLFGVGGWVVLFSCCSCRTHCYFEV